jgi:hypothetical protein
MEEGPGVKEFELFAGAMLARNFDNALRYLRLSCLKGYKRAMYSFITCNTLKSTVTERLFIAIKYYDNPTRNDVSSSNYALMCVTSTPHMNATEIYNCGKYLYHRVWKQNIDDHLAASNVIGPCDASMFSRALMCVLQYHKSSTIHREQTFAWMFCAPRLGLCKDVAWLIGTFVWDMRFEPSAALAYHDAIQAKKRRRLNRGL